MAFTWADDSDIITVDLISQVHTNINTINDHVRCVSLCGVVYDSVQSSQKNGNYSSYKDGEDGLYNGKCDAK